MPLLRASIVHISDLHFGRNIDRELLPHLQRVLKESVAPTFLIVSGDVAENPSPRQMKSACEYIRGLAIDCNIPRERLLVIPGNHDYKIKGNVGFGRLTRIPFEVYFRRNGLDLKRPSRWWLYAKLILNALWPGGKDLKDDLLIKDSPEYGITLIGFNSTPLFEWFATGKVEEAQISGMASALAKEGRTELDSFLKVAVVHHHPIPIPYVSTGRISRLQESFMIFHNAGTFLREVARCGVTLVLHGHKHFAGFTDVAYDTPDGQWRKVGVLACGSTTHSHPDDPLGNEFNLVNVYDDDTIAISQWYLSTDVRKSDHGRNYNSVRLSDVREQRNRAASGEYGLTIGQLRKEVKITNDGYSEISIFLEDCRAAKVEGLNFYRVSLDSPYPAYLRDFELGKSEKSPPFLTIRNEDCKKGLRTIDARLTFGEVLKPSDGVFDLLYKYRLMNGHSVNAREFQRKYFGVEVAWEYASIVCEHAVESLKLKVEFPGQPDLERALTYGAEVLYVPSPAWLDPDKRYDDTECLQHDGETSRFRTRVKVEENCLELDVAAPVPGFTYRIRWTYCEDAIPESNRAEEGRLALVRARLIEGARAVVADGSPPSHFAEVENSLMEVLKCVEDQYPKVDAMEQLEISLAVFDDEESVLRFVAASHARLKVFFAETFRPGEGCAGFTFEKSRVLFYDFANSTLQYYISRAEAEEARGRASGLVDHKVLVTIPWIESNIPLGVISIGSTSTASGLLRLFDLEESKQEEAKDFFIGLTKIIGANIVSLLLE